MPTQTARTITSALLVSGVFLALGCPSERSGSSDGEAGSATSDTGSNDTTDSTATSNGTSTTTTTTGADSSSGNSGSSTGAEVDCSDRPTGRPSVRSELDGVWDGDRGAVIMFGGDQGIPVMCSPQSDFVADTWAFHSDCDSFELLDSGSGPSPRGRHAVALDSLGGRMIIQGGRFRPETSGTYTLYDDTWAFDLATDTWEELGTGGPSARTNHTAVVANNQLLIYGGNASSNGLAFSPLDDLWSLNLDTLEWTELNTIGAPSARLFHAAAVSDDESTMFVYGGGDENAFTGPFFPDLFALDLSTGEWTELHDGSASAPVGSIWGDLLFDGNANRLLLWGAHEDNLLGNNNKIWQFDLQENSWLMLEEGDVLDNTSATFCDFPVDFVAYAKGTPERRSAGVGVLTDDSELLIFGGKTDCGFVDDVWSWPLAGGQWNNRVRATLGEICVRAFAEGCDSMCI